MNYLWNIFGVLLSLYPIYFTDAQSLTASSKCVTPDKKMGRCISLFECNDFARPAPGKRPDAKAIEFFRRSICGRGNNGPMICCSSSVAYSTTTVKNELLSSESCGVSGPMQKINGGEPTLLGDYPWMAALGYRRSLNSVPAWLCGGSLINSRYVLTAAHCTTIKFWEMFTVRLGDLDLNNKITDGASPVNYPIERIIAHEKHNDFLLSNDIALVKLRSPVQFTNLITPICLPVANELRRTNLENQIGYVAGWGKTSYESSSNSHTTHLQHVKLPILNLSICKKAYRVVPRTHVDNTNICAGYLEGKKDSCQGDSGGPLMWINPTDSKYYLIGIVSFGYKCAEPGYPGVYTKVSEYVDWIQQNMN